MEIFEPIILAAIAFIVGYVLGGHHAIDTVTDKIIEDPEGFVNLVKNAKGEQRETLELHRDKGVIYCFGKEKGFLAQAEDLDTLALRIREALPNSGYFIPAQKGFSTDELYNLAKLLQKTVDNA